MGIYQHFREEEHSFIDQVFSWLEQVQQTYEYRLTDFLDPREQKIVQKVIGSNNPDFRFEFHGGTEDAERKRAIIAPFYEQLTKDSYELVILEGKYNEKFISITHRDVMGAFLSSGIERSKLGDILTGVGVFQLITDETIAPYVMSQLTSVKQAHIQLQRKPFSELIESVNQWKTFERVIPSLRLDAVISSFFNISRNNATALIKGERVKVNHRTVDQITFALEQGDLISVRGYGRGRFKNIIGRTRKNNLKVKAARLKI